MLFAWCGVMGQLWPCSYVTLQPMSSPSSKFQTYSNFHLHFTFILNKAKATPVVSLRLWSNLNFPLRTVSGMVVVSSSLLKIIIELFSDSTSNGGGTFMFIEGANSGALELFSWLLCTAACTTTTCLTDFFDDESLLSKWLFSLYFNSHGLHILAFLFETRTNWCHVLTASIF